MIMNKDYVQNTNDLVDKLYDFCSKIWPDVTGYKDALPDPDSKTRPQNRTPLFVIIAQTGRYSCVSAYVDVQIGLQFASNASENISYIEAVRQIRNHVDKFNLEIFNHPSGLFYGALIGDISWEIPADAARPVWQGLMNITFELPHGVHNNNNFLV
jgi:hypothetical protein